MKLLHLQQVSVVAHTTHNRLSPINRPTFLSPNLTLSPQPPTKLNPTLSTPTSSNPILSNLITPDYPIPHSILFTPTQTFHLSIHPSIHIHPYTDAYTLTRLIVNKLLTLYISIDILTFMWYNNDIFDIM